MKIEWMLAVLGAAWVAAVPIASAQDTSPDGQFGLGVQDHWVDGSEFRSISGNAMAVDDFGFWRLLAGATAEAPLKLPNGVRIVSMNCPILSNNPVNTSIALVRRGYDTATQDRPVLLVANPVASVTGYGVLQANALSHVYRQRTSETMTNWYVVRSFLGTERAVAGCRFTYQRQIAPAPATARFTDVPLGAQFFAEVEAMAASGITGGCTAAQFCPDQPVTRRQMAAFFARALGLHWPAF